jgi:rhamnosyltransferase
MRTPSVSVVVPTLCGGRLLEAVVTSVLGAPGVRVAELLLVDSGSSKEELLRMRRAGARLRSIDRDAFDHGLTRDLGARETSGEILVFLNQDALPVDGHWLERLVAPFESGDPPAAVQGGIREFPSERLAELGRRRFYWDSCGPRFYFTRESEAWIARHGGIGFSTVNCAIARWAWEQLPFGPAAILEDKLWQKRAAERGWQIVEAPEAVVWHTHDYDVRSLTRRCVSEGYGWRLVGERYRLGTALGDLARSEVWRDWWRGLRGGALSRPAELLFPVLRPLALWWGNRWARGVLH